MEAAGSAVALAVAPGELDGALVRLRARVAEEHPPAAAQQRVQSRGHFRLHVVVVEIRDVQQCARLVGDRGRDVGVGVSERRHRETREEVEVLLAFAVPELRAFAAHERDRQPAVRLHHVLGVECLQLGQRAHE